MNHPDLVKKMNDAEFTRRYNHLFFLHSLSLLPLLVFVVVLWRKTSSLEPAAVYFGGASYLLVLLCLRVLWRRDVLYSMRREGVIDSSYRPPVL